MNALHATYVLLFVGAAIACLGTLVQTRRLASREVRRGLAGLLALSGCWALAIVVQLLVPTLAMKATAYTGGLVVGFGTVFAWLYFVSAYTGRGYHRSRRLVTVAAVVYLLPTLVKVTNPLHHAYFTATLATEPFPHMALDHGGFHWVTLGLAYVLSAIGFWILYDAFRDRDTPVRLFLLVGVTALPVLPNVVATVTPTLLLGVSYEPLGVAVFAVGVLFFAQDSFLELSSTGHTQLVDVLSEGFLLLDDGGRVVSYNDQAEAVYPALTDGTDSLAALDGDLAALARGEQRIVTATVEGRTRHYKATKKDIEAGPQFISTAVTLADVTRLVHLEEVTSVHSKVNEATCEARTESEVKRRVCEELATVASYRFVWVASVDGDRVHVDHVAGDAGDYLDAIDRDPPASGDERDPVVAVATREDRYSGVVEVADDGASWERRAADLGVTTCLPISLATDDQERCVLGVYTTSEQGFTEPEQAMFAEIRETLRHALSAIEAHEEARQYQEAVNQAGYALFIMDVDGTIRYVNPAFEEITGYTATEAVGRTPDLLTGDGAGPGDMWDVVASGAVWEGQVRNRRKGGERYWARRTVAPVSDEDGDLTAVIAIEVDVTDQRVRRQRLDVLNRVLRHNLRNAVSVIAGNAELILDREEHADDGTTADLVTPAERIRDSAADLIRLSEKAHRAEQLIDTNDRGTATVELESVLEELRAELAGEFPDGDVVVSPPSNRSVTVNAAIRPALVELARNGLEHSGPEPRLRIEASSAPDGVREDVTITVVDDGPGLPAQERDILERGDETALTHGSGLGLWLVNWLVMECGGRLDIGVEESGTTVTLTIPEVSDDPSRSTGRSLAR